MIERIERGRNVRRRGVMVACAAALAVGAVTACTKTQPVAANANPVAAKPFKLNCVVTETQHAKGPPTLAFGGPRKVIFQDPEIANGQNPPTYWGAQVDVSAGFVVKDKDGNEIPEESSTKDSVTWVVVHNGGGEARLFYGAGDGKFPVNWESAAKYPFVRDPKGHVFHQSGMLLSAPTSHWVYADWRMTPAERDAKGLSLATISGASVECGDGYGKFHPGIKPVPGIPLLMPPNSPNGVKDLPIPGE